MITMKMRDLNSLERAMLLSVKMSDSGDITTTELQVEVFRVFSTELTGYFR